MYDTTGTKHVLSVLDVYEQHKEEHLTERLQGSDNSLLKKMLVNQYVMLWHKPLALRIKPLCRA